jgi:hypothetical protein
LRDYFFLPPFFFAAFFFAAMDFTSNQLCVFVSVVLWVAHGLLQSPALRQSYFSAAQKIETRNFFRRGRRGRFAVGKIRNSTVQPRMGG